MAVVRSMTVHEMAEALRCSPVRENARRVLCSMVPTDVTAELYDLLVALPEHDPDRRMAETVRRWTSDHGMNGKPCHCLLCSALARYDQETAR